MKTKIWIASVLLVLASLSSCSCDRKSADQVLSELDSIQKADSLAKLTVPADSTIVDSVKTTDEKAK
jgi:uncharacterized lipoprotein